MGMGYGACYADVIKAEDVWKLCPKEYEAFLDAVAKSDMSLDEFAIDHCVLIDIDPEVIDCWNALYKKFEEVTGLELDIYYHNSEDNGDRYDDVDGVFFAVEGMYELSEAGKKMKDKVQRQLYVTYG
jgi:hypothetical protein